MILWLGGARWNIGVKTNLPTKISSSSQWALTGARKFGRDQKPVCWAGSRRELKLRQEHQIGLFGKLIVLLMLAVYITLQGPSCFFFLIKPIACFCCRRCFYSRPFFSSSGAGKTILWSLQTHRSPNKKQLKGALSVSVHRKVKYIILTQNSRQGRLKLEAGRWEDMKTVSIFIVLEMHMKNRLSVDYFYWKIIVEEIKLSALF